MYRSSHCSKIQKRKPSFLKAIITADCLAHEDVNTWLEMTLYVGAKERNNVQYHWPLAPKLLSIRLTTNLVIVSLSYSPITVQTSSNEGYQLRSWSGSITNLYLTMSWPAERNVWLLVLYFPPEYYFSRERAELRAETGCENRKRVVTFFLFFNSHNVKKEIEKKETHLNLKSLNLYNKWVFLWILERAQP